MKRTPSGRLAYRTRDVSSRRPMHVTSRVLPDVPSMRCPEALAIVRQLVRQTRERGVRVVAYAVLGTHIHLLVRARSRAAMGDAMRYFFSLLARRLNALFARRGPVWEERFASRVARNAKQLWHTLNYVLRNPFAANCPCL